LRAQQEDKEGWLKGEIERLNALIAPLNKEIEGGYVRMEEEDPWCEDVDFDVYNQKWQAFEETIRSQND